MFNGRTRVTRYSVGARVPATRFPPAPLRLAVSVSAYYRVSRCSGLRRKGGTFVSRKARICLQFIIRTTTSRPDLTRDRRPLRTVFSNSQRRVLHSRVGTTFSFSFFFFSQGIVRRAGSESAMWSVGRPRSSVTFFTRSHVVRAEPP